MAKTPATRCCYNFMAVCQTVSSLRITRQGLTRIIGIQAAAQAPQLYRAYIGVAQMSNQLESEKLANDFMRQRFMDDGNTKMVRRLDQSPIGNTVPPMTSVFAGLFLASLLNREYTLGEKIIRVDVLAGANGLADSD